MRLWHVFAVLAGAVLIAASCIDVDTDLTAEISGRPYAIGLAEIVWIVHQLPYEHGTCLDGATSWTARTDEEFAFACPGATEPACAVRRGKSWTIVVAPAVMHRDSVVAHVTLHALHECVYRLQDTMHVNGSVWLPGPDSAEGSIERVIQQRDM